MSTEPGSSSTQPDEQPIGGSTNTVALLKASILNADYGALQEHLETNHTEQSMLNRCLMLGLQDVQRKMQKMERVAPALQLLLQSGAKWNSDDAFEHQMTPYHLICKSAGDHHELVELLIQSSKRTLLGAKDYYRYTALMYAVKNANINCLRSLIAHGACVKIDYTYVEKQPICLAIHGLKDHSKHSSIIMTLIFDLLLDNGADVNKAMRTAMSLGNIESMKKLIAKGAKLKHDNGYDWKLMAKRGPVNLLRCLYNSAFGKGYTGQNGRYTLWWVTQSGQVDAIRYLLDLGVTMPTHMRVHMAEACHELCKHCGRDTLVLDLPLYLEDPVDEALSMDKLDIVQLFEEYGSQSFKHLSTFRLAMTCSSVTVIEYLHRKYGHSLNINYTTSDIKVYPHYKHWTFLSEACIYPATKSIVYLLEQGADLNKVAKDRCPSALMVAILSSHVEVIALLICNGADTNFRSYDYKYGDVLPFETAVLYDRGSHQLGHVYVAEMLLVSGCSCGVFSLEEDHTFKAKLGNCEIINLMMKWNVQENNVKPLKQQCRREILKHLSPRASKMIEKLPLPPGLIKYLSIPELDDIVARCKRMRFNKYGIKRYKTISGLRFFQ